MHGHHGGFGGGWGGGFHHGGWGGGWGGWHPHAHLGLGWGWGGWGLGTAAGLATGKPDGKFPLFRFFVFSFFLISYVSMLIGAILGSAISRPCYNCTAPQPTTVIVQEPPATANVVPVPVPVPQQQPIPPQLPPQQYATYPPPVPGPYAYGATGINNSTAYPPAPSRPPPSINTSGIVLKNFQAHPGTYEISVSAGDRVEILHFDSGWVFVDCKGMRGFVPAEFVKTISSEPQEKQANLKEM